MAKRLQVLLDETEWRDVRRIARGRRMTVAAWVREALRLARQREPHGAAADKIAAVRSAARHAFPAGDIDQMLGEIERGYRSRDLQ